MRKKVWQLAEELLPSRRVGEFNQALMELGALVCTSQGPRCGNCPLAEHCRARQFGLQDRIPPRSRRVAIQEVAEVALVVYRGKKVLLVQRPSTGRWANMWEFPHAAMNPGETTAAVGERLLAEKAGIQAVPEREILTLRHGITRFRITMVCLAACYRSGRFSSHFYQQGKWVELEELARYPVSAPQRRLARSLMEKHGI